MEKKRTIENSIVKRGGYHVAPSRIFFDVCNLQNRLNLSCTISRESHDLISHLCAFSFGYRHLHHVSFNTFYSWHESHHCTQILFRSQFSQMTMASPSHDLVAIVLKVSFKKKDPSLVLDLLLFDGRMLLYFSVTTSSYKRLQNTEIIHLTRPMTTGVLVLLPSVGDYVMMLTS